MFSLEKLNENFSSIMESVPNGDIGIGVSGGGDSMALLLLASEWALRNDRCIKVATVDHGLRSGSSSECEYVKKICTDLSIEHTTLKWLEKPIGNLQNSARKARHRLFTEWITKKKLCLVMLGHTLDDNAETIMIRLIRGSGIDGLTGISKTKKLNGLDIFRPLLSFSRKDLRSYLQVKNTRWIDEPSNFDERFERIKIRNVLPQLSKIGLTPIKFVALANHMARAKDAINSEVVTFTRLNVIQRPWGDLEIGHYVFTGIPEEYQLRLLSEALRWISGSIYRPRFSSLERLLKNIRDEKLGLGVCLMGCIIKYKEKKIIFSREFSAIENRISITKDSFIWENRWKLEVHPKKVNNALIGPLGKDGLKKVLKNNDTEVPTSALICSVAMFEGGHVSCVPILSFGTGLTSTLIGGTDSFLNFLLTY